MAQRSKNYAQHFLAPLSPAEATSGLPPTPTPASQLLHKTWAAPLYMLTWEKIPFHSVGLTSEWAGLESQCCVCRGRWRCPLVAGQQPLRACLEHSRTERRDRAPKKDPTPPLSQPLQASIHGGAALLVSWKLCWAPGPFCSQGHVDFPCRLSQSPVSSLPN